MKKKICMLLLAVTVSMAGLVACGENTEEPASKAETMVNEEGQQAPEENPEGDAEAAPEGGEAVPEENPEGEQGETAEGTTEETTEGTTEETTEGTTQAAGEGEDTPAE